MSQVAYFLKIDGVDGESTDDRHKGEIELTSWNFGASNMGPAGGGAGGGGAGKANVREMRFTKKVDKASVRLFVACCSGEHLKSATLVCRNGGDIPVEFLKILMANVSVNAFDAAGPADIAPVEQMSLQFGRIEIHYVALNPDGTLAPEIVGGWDLVANRKI